MAELNNNKCRRLADFYAGRSIFITGASGFIGKVLVEKLLYSCSDLKNVYILLRPKREKSVECRLEEMLKLPLFQRVQKEKPHMLKRVIAVPGDITVDRLGIREDMRQKLIDEVSVIFHGAATLKLEANLKDSVLMNTWGTHRVLELAKEIKNLDVFVHLSTAFCHVDHQVLEEKAYDFEYKPEDIMNLVTWIDNKHLDKITFDMIHPHPNTYTFTKRLAERLVIQEYPNLPVCIARPSIVCPSYREPFPGWVDSLNGPVGILVAGAKGVLRSMYAKRDYNAEVVPVDFAINGLLAIARNVATEKKSKEIPVYNITQAQEKTVTWGEILEVGKSFTFELPFSVMLWFPDGNIRGSLWSHKIYAFFLHWLPAYFIDFMLFLFCQKRFMIRVQKKIEVGLEVLQYFTTHKWCFRNRRLLDLRDSLCPEDRKEFGMEFSEVETNAYMRNCVLGARVYMFKEPMENLPRARRLVKVLYVIDRLTRLLLLFFAAKFIIFMSGTLIYIFEETGKHLKNVPFVRSFVPHDDALKQRHI